MRAELDQELGQQATISRDLGRSHDHVERHLSALLVEHFLRHAECYAELQALLGLTLFLDAAHAPEPVHRHVFDVGAKFANEWFPERINLDRLGHW